MRNLEPDKKRAWLNRYNINAEKIGALSERLERLEDASGEAISKRGRLSIEDQRGELRERIQRLERTGSEIRSEIAHSLDCLDPQLSEILELRYLDGLKPEEIGDQVGLCRRHVYRLLAQAIEEIEILSA